MKNSGYILNLSRGPVINEKDLEYALEKKNNCWSRLRCY
jgi:lactate dehydrogenase-like 2-hydroxyacid dehydrogenase